MKLGLKKASVLKKERKISKQTPKTQPGRRGGWQNIVLLTLAFLIFPAAFNYAVRIDKGKFVTQLSKGETYRASIMIENPLQQEVSVNVYLEDFTYVSPFDGTKKFYPPGSTEVSISDWINFSPQKFTLSPYSRKRFSFRIKPTDNVNSVHCGVLFFESPLGKSNSEMGISIIGKIGSLIFIEPEQSNKKAVFTDITGGLRKIKGNFANTGNTLITAKGTYYIMDTGGMVKTRGKIKELYMLPTNNTFIKMKIPKDLPSQKYTMVMTFNLKEGDVLVKEVDFLFQSSGNIEILEIRD